MKNIEEITIRPVTEADAEKLLAIYAPHVTDTLITYEYTVPTVEEFGNASAIPCRHIPILRQWKTAESSAMPMPLHFIPEGRISGLRKQQFIWNAGRGRGVGRLLYERLEEAEAAECAECQCLHCLSESAEHCLP